MQFMYELARESSVKLVWHLAQLMCTSLGSTGLGVQARSNTGNLLIESLGVALECESMKASLDLYPWGLT